MADVKINSYRVNDPTKIGGVDGGSRCFAKIQVIKIRYSLHAEVPPKRLIVRLIVNDRQIFIEHFVLNLLIIST